MKKLIYAISALALLTGISASCQKESSPVQDNGQSSQFTVTATIADNNGTKVSYAEDGSTHALKPSWQVDDILIGFDGAGHTYGYKVTSLNEGQAILDIIKSGEYVGSVTSNPSNGTKMYMFYAPGKKPGDISSKSLTVSLASQSKDVVPALMMASATVTDNCLSFSFENKTAIIAIKDPTMAVASKPYTSITLSGTGVNTELVFNLDGSGNLQANYQTPGTITKTVEFTTGSDKKSPSNTLIYIVSSPVVTATDLTFTTNNLEWIKKSAVSVLIGNYYYMTPSFALPAGALPGEFSVSAAKKVHFSNGNMYYDGSSYKFEANQYDFRHYNGYGNDAAVIDGTSTTTPAGTVGSFYWIKNTETAIHPYDGSYGTPDPGNSTDDIIFTNATQDTPKSGFTCNGLTGVWRTLSTNEWKYLLNIENAASGARTQTNRYAKAMLSGVKGLLIFPDGYNGTTAVTGVTGIAAVNTNDVAYPASSIEAATWTAMEADGCVFLPATGYRREPDVYAAGSGFYWSSRASDPEYAYSPQFENGKIEHDEDLRRWGFPIRLVMEP